ncbi:MAG: preprotein translocase subunit SecG [Dehalococcoidia bacterium]|nr:preprotein translocase subunit SecG [Dehalococcoidia bacterium]
MPTYLYIAQIVIAIALIAVILLQTKGGGLGATFGQSDSSYRTKRGVERTLLHVTIVLAVIFVIVAILCVRMS